MSVYFCGYPIWHTLYITDTNPIGYNILIGQQEVYSGEILPFDITGDTVRVDISHVCRAYLETFYEDIPFAGVLSSLVPNNGIKSTVHTFTVTSPNNSPDDREVEVDYTVVYNYNTSYMLGGEDVANINNPIFLEADPRQLLFISGYAVAGSTSYGWSKNGGTVNSYPALGTRYQVLSLQLNSEAVNAQQGDTITLTQDATRYDYYIVKPCRNRFALYYVNKMGGIDSLLCSGRYVKKWSPSRTDARLYDDRRDRMDFQQTRLYQEISHRWELNTGWVEDDKAELIDELVYTPKCWIHDLDKDTITSCLVTDTSYSADRFKLDDTPAQYTINVEESQLHERQ